MDYKNMEMWFARDTEYNFLYVFVAKPIYNEEQGVWEDLESENGYEPLCLYDECYLDITFENSPIKVSDYFKHE